MPYTNTIVTTSTSGTWNGTLFSYSGISLIDGIPHSAQLEVERVFTVPRDTTNYATIEDFLNNSATTQKDKQQVFIIPASRITFNETNKTITAIDLPSTGNTYDFNPDGIGLANVPVPAIAVSDALKVRRKTVSNQSLVEWAAGTKLTSAQLNLEVKQLLYLVQELIDKTTTEVTVSNTTIGTIPNYSIVPTKLSAGAPAWLSSGNVGIGDTSPSTKLQIAVLSTGTTLTGVNKYGGIHLTQNNVNDEFTGITTAGPSSGTQGGILFQGANTYGIKMHFLTTDHFVSGMKNRMTLDHLGNLGIGTTSPSQKLHVNAGTIRVDNTDANGISLISTGTGAGGSNFQVAHKTTGNVTLLNSGGGIAFETSATERMRIANDGNVGIGTTNPVAKLHVVSSGGASCRLEGNNVSQVMGYIGAGDDIAYTGTLSNHPYSLITNNTARLNITANGNVGIGIGNPTTKLHVSGSSATTESIYLANSSSTSFVQTIAAGSTGVPAAGVPENSVWIEGAPASTGNTYLSSYNNNLAFATGLSRTERMRIDSSGNVGIGTTAPVSKLHIKNGGICYQRPQNTSRVYSNVGSYFADGDITGIVEISIPSNGWTEPVGGSNINTMLDITIEGRNYVPSSSWTIKISAYFYGTGSQWHSSSAQIIGRCPFSTIRLGFNTSTNKPVILLGETNTVLSYPLIRVSNISTSYSNEESPSFSSEWPITGAINSTANYILTYSGSTPTVAYSLDTSGISTFRAALNVTGTVAATGIITANSGGTVGGAAAPATLLVGTASSIGIYVTSAAPTFSAVKGSICINTGGAANTRLYVNNNGSTGWSAVTSA